MSTDYKKKKQSFSSKKKKKKSQYKKKKKKKSKLLRCHNTYQFITWMSHRFILFTRIPHSSYTHLHTALAPALFYWNTIAMLALEPHCSQSYHSQSHHPQSCC